MPLVGVSILSIIVLFFPEKMNSNPYIQQILQQGKEPSKVPAPKVEYPRTIGARTFQTEEEYKEALNNFLNCM